MAALRDGILFVKGLQVTRGIFSEGVTVVPRDPGEVHWK